MTDDRMDRAERIRNMREGNRGTDDEAADDEAADDAESATDAGESDTGADAASDTETATDAASPSQGDATASSPDTTTAEVVESAPTGTPSAGGASADDAADEATAAAQRAAAAAAETMGQSGTTTETQTMDETPDTTGGGLLAQGPTGVELPDKQLLEEAMANSTVETSEGAARAAAAGGETSQSEELVRVLEFSLGDEYYCLDIEYVEEIVKRNSVTRVPNTPEFVDGVVDLRGQITTILEPKEMMDIDAEGKHNLIVVFDPEQFEEQGAVGWVVDEVRQVVPITESDVNDPPVDAEYINGVVDREEYDQFVIWVEPDDALAQATDGGEE